ncbi:MAG: hydrogenase subunit MbhD domain-containing protein [Planctomycetota bacterium]
MDSVFLYDVTLLALMTATALAVVTVRHLLAATMLLGFYSLLMALVWNNMYAMDVAFTEAAVGAGVSTILLIGALVHTGTKEREDGKKHWPELLLVVVTGAVLIYGTFDMPPFGDPSAPIHHHGAPEYILQKVGKAAAHGSEDESGHESHAGAGAGSAHGDDEFAGHVPNLVTAVLADYRGYDTMFETAVIFTAGVCLVLLLRPANGRARRRRGRRDRRPEPAEEAP